MTLLTDLFVAHIGPRIERDASDEVHCHTIPHSAGENCVRFKIAGKRGSVEGVIWNNELHGSSASELSQRVSAIVRDAVEKYWRLGS